MKGAKILLLDDNREARWPLARVLRSEGAEVTEADDGTDGLKLLERSTFDLIIADVCMPDLGGFGLFSKLRFGDEEGGGSLPHADVPVVLVTGQVSRGELARGLEAGLDDFIAKPVDLDEFRARIRAVLRRARASARPQTRTQGDLRDFGISALTQALALSGHSGRLTVRSGKAFGVLDFHGGHLVHAHYTAAGYDQQGEDAALHVLGVDQGSFELEPVPASAPRTIFGDTQGLILRHATEADEALFVSRTAAGASPPPADDDDLPIAVPEPITGPVTGPLPPPISRPVSGSISQPVSFDVEPTEALGEPAPITEGESDDAPWVDVAVKVNAPSPAAEPDDDAEPADESDLAQKSGAVVFDLDESNALSS